ncbi:hypothetical protein ES705_28339 [subsurface metagenome]
MSPGPLVSLSLGSWNLALGTCPACLQPQACHLASWNLVLGTCLSYASGSITLNVVPLPILLFTSILPP